MQNVGKSTNLYCKYNNPDVTIVWPRPPRNLSHASIKVKRVTSCSCHGKAWPYSLICFYLIDRPESQGSSLYHTNLARAAGLAQGHKSQVCPEQDLNLLSDYSAARMQNLCYRSSVALNGINNLLYSFIFHYLQDTIKDFERAMADMVAVFVEQVQGLYPFKTKFIGGKIFEFCIFMISLCQ